MKKLYIVYDVFKYEPNEIEAVINNIEFCTERKEIAEKHKGADTVVIPGIVAKGDSKETVTLWFSVKNTNYRRAFVCVSKIRRICGNETAKKLTKGPTFQYNRYREIKLIKKRGPKKNECK